MREGFRFACQPGCTECCRQRGFVYLNAADLERAAVFVGMTPAAFERRYVYRTRNTMRFRVPPKAHCPFLLEDRCSIHPAKPAQCRAFPFWPELIATRKEWNRTASYCPGIGKGPLIQIEKALARARGEDTE
jgi:Fe-S-cluster containining protein